MKPPVSRLWTARRRAGFSLVEVTLAVGIMAFSLVGVLGVLPLAMNSGRQSFNQARASAVANTIFASIRNQPFSDVHYLDSQFDATTGQPITGASDTLDLNILGAAAGNNNVTSSAPNMDSRKFYAKFPDVPGSASDDPSTATTARHIAFTSAQPPGGADYQVTMYFNNQPDGTIVPSNTAAGRVGQANCIVLVVSSAVSDGSNTLRDPYRFVTTVANRMN